ncbi:AgmX/PglI C-terminal domain-containing protein [Bdellovibrio svalbardensis]|uniref:AgmX/PglI C-terminal domain-containing protein n=1 Tax=Bdellovibrio svalbardensis TaxID=2972972 RepID=A0ABT6DIS3_9BACT|nr:AgmX/PglI C-terminal domain-containing protein [Bdellovibrio svalbardensis]MDG0816758.1 AgmX/PglI C-terminal domain-containing protein [Bdellovibrio svalbardensis]
MRSPIIFRIFKDNQLVGVKQFDQDQIVIGHDADVNVDLDSDQVSPIHCMIERRDNGFYICDLGSQSGTFKNGQAVLDESISTGDELSVGPFKISFFVGVPKPKTIPGAVTTEAVASVAATPVMPTSKPETNMPPAAVVKTEEIKATPAIPVEAPRVEEKPAIPVTPVRPEIKAGHVQFKKKKSVKTFAPPSEIQDLKTYLKPGKGAVVQVIVAWKERILTTYHFKGTNPVKVNVGGDRQVALPDGLAPKGFALLDFTGGLKINTTADMNIEMVSAAGLQQVDDLTRTGKAQRGGAGHTVRLDQNEMLCVTLPGGNLTLYVRYVPQGPVVPMLPSMMLSGSELTGLVMSVVMVSLLALYISATTPKDWQENKQEDVQRIAQVIFNKTPAPTPPPPAPKPTPTPPPPEAVTPPPPEKKVVVADANKEAQRKGPQAPAAAQSQVAARANEVAPKPNAKDRTKKFTSTRQGGAVKMGNTAGANAQSANKDLSKVGLFSAFGGGGNRANIDKAYSGAGEVLGMADKASGASGFNENRAGDDLGSKFKDAGAGGKGTATQGIAGIGTKGRSSGQSAYGAADGFGSKSSVAIAGGGMEESFDATIDKEAIRRVIRAKLHEVKSCYERALNTLEKGRKLEGKVVLGWEIIEKGQARNVSIKSSSLNNSVVENCIRDRLASWIFPEPPQGLVAEVKAYPFVFNQQN